MSPALANFLFEAANFLLLAVALGWVLFKPVRRALDAERERHAKEENESKRLRAEAETLAQEARAARAATDCETAAQRAEVLAAAQKEGARLVEEARKSQTIERRSLEQELKSARDAEVARLAETIGRIAGESVTRLLHALELSSLDIALVRAACDQLRKLPSAARASALVESARTLDAEERRLLEAALGAGFNERIVSELGAGVRVTTSSGQVEATTVSLAREAARAVTAASTRPVSAVGGVDG